jgi:PAS domain S-box-containing protein
MRTKGPNRRSHNGRATARTAGAKRQAKPTLEKARAAARAQPLRIEYTDLFDFGPVAHILVDGIGIVLKVNLAACRLLGTERALLVGHPLLGCVIPEDRREVLDHLRRCRVGADIVESEIRLMSRNGRVITARAHSRRAVYQDRDVYPTIIVDLSDHILLDEARLAAERQREQAERDARRAQAASATKDRFLATVSHELRTPLTPALVAASRLAAWEGLPRDAGRLAATIKRNIELEARLIDDLLDVARINRDRIDLQFDTVDVHDIVLQAIGICRSFADEKNVTINNQLVATDHHVAGDQGRLRQVFWNLLNNAIKFTQAGGSITVGTSNVSDDVVRVAVRDTGAGMSPTVLETLFSPFEHQAIHNESRSGLGLGLAICKGIVGAHQGQIWASSEGPGRGSTFAVELRTVTAEAGSDVSEAEPLQRQDIIGDSKRRVLLVEDDADTGEMLSLFLFHNGYEVEVASTLSAGLNRLDETWDVVLSDLGLPDGSGLEIARRAQKSLNPPTRLIALTGYGTSHDIKATEEAGFDEHLVKPIDLEKLIHVLNGVAERR